MVFNLFAYYLSGTDNANHVEKTNKSVILRGAHNDESNYNRKQVQAGLKVARVFLNTIGREDDLMTTDKVLDGDDRIIADALEIYLIMAVNNRNEGHSHAKEGWKDTDEEVSLAALIYSGRMIQRRKAMLGILGSQKIEDADERLLESHFKDRAIAAVKFLVDKNLINLKYYSDGSVSDNKRYRTDSLGISLPDVVRNAFK